MKDNWRGRTRFDKLADEGEVVDVAGVPSDDECDEGEWNENALRNAISRGMSMWRSHTGEKEMRTFRFRTKSRIF